MSRDLDIKVAELVMEWRRVERPAGWTCGATFAYLSPAVLSKAMPMMVCPLCTGVPVFTSDATCDAIVLHKVRAGWTLERQWKFDDEIQEILRRRIEKVVFEATGQRNASYNYLGPHILYYEPGDFSRAALRTLGEHVSI